MFPQCHNVTFDVNFKLEISFSQIALFSTQNLLSKQDTSSISQGLSGLYRHPQCQILPDYTKEDDKENITGTELRPKCRYGQIICLFWTPTNLGPNW